MNQSSELRKYQVEIARIKSKWNAAFKEKEKWANSKKESGRAISKLIRELKNKKKDRNVINDNIKALKKTRDQKNNQTKELIEKAKDLNQKKAKLAKEHKVQGDPGKIKRDLDNLNQKLETEVFSFDKEKAIMKQINQLRKEYDKVKEISNVWDQLHKIDQEINESKKEAKKTHSEIQELAKKSETLHNNVLELSKKIDELKVKEDEAIKELEAKNKIFEELDKQLQEFLDKSSEVRQTATEKKESKKKNKRQQDKEKLKEKNKEVSEKIKKKEKLTTEDLLAFQASGK